MNFLRYIPMVTVMGIIFFLSSQPGGSFVLPKIIHLDKLLHAVVYGLLAWAVLYAVSEGTRLVKPYRVSLVVVVFCLLYGISDEFHQSFVPGREPSLMDILADTLGAAAAVLVWVKFFIPAAFWPYPWQNRSK